MYDPVKCPELGIYFQCIPMYSNVFQCIPIHGLLTQNWLFGIKIIFVCQSTLPHIRWERVTYIHFHSVVDVKKKKKTVRKVCNRRTYLGGKTSTGCRRVIICVISLIFLFTAPLLTNITVWFWWFFFVECRYHCSPVYA